MLALTVSGLDFVMMMTAARYSLPEQDLAAMDILANIIIPAVRDAHWLFYAFSSRQPHSTSLANANANAKEAP
ncbi:hypothetical protein [Bradyrhizobium sp. B120]|uniref:hypothetical protein n=1 Tax=Bradyrhizobium sp. B120 TaxID=3410088 RepID=UPI003B984A83